MLIWPKELSLSRFPAPSFNHSSVVCTTVDNHRYTSVFSKLPVSEWLPQIAKPYLAKDCNDLSICLLSLYDEAFQIPFKTAEVWRFSVFG